MLKTSISSIYLLNSFIHNWLYVWHQKTQRSKIKAFLVQKGWHSCKQTVAMRGINAITELCSRYSGGIQEEVPNVARVFYECSTERVWEDKWKCSKKTKRGKVRGNSTCRFTEVRKGKVQSGKLNNLVSLECRAYIDLVVKMNGINEGAWSRRSCMHAKEFGLHLVAIGISWGSFGEGNNMNYE